MKVLVVGQGGREHAICRALARDGAELVAAPGNPGVAAHARCTAIAVNDVAGLVKLARDERVDLVVPGPEAALVAGLADALAAARIPCCGPSRAAAQLEGSKAFMREVVLAAQVAGPAFRVVRDVAELDAAMAEMPGLPVVKADGLAAGKGVVLPETREGCVSEAKAFLAGGLGDAGRTVVLEERLSGVEASLFYACDGKHVVPLPHARDHKRIFDDDKGPNTGGMGAVSPNPAIDAAREHEVRTAIVEPVVAELARRGIPYVGFLYAGVMLTARGVKLLEFNARLGDPEAQAVLPRLQQGELVRLCMATARGELAQYTLAVDPRPAVAVVVCATGYPAAPRRGDVIRIEASLVGSDRWLDQAGTSVGAGGVLQTSGGRVAAVVARGASVREARERAYEGVGLVRFDGMHYRRDIAKELS